MTLLSVEQRNERGWYAGVYIPTYTDTHHQNNKVDQSTLFDLKQKCMEHNTHVWRHTCTNILPDGVDCPADFMS